MKKSKIKFTMSRVQAMAPAERTSYAYDSAMDGLELIITKKGTKTFYFHKRISGKSCRIRLGRFPGMNVEQARKACIKTAAAFYEGRDPQAEKRAQRAQMTLRELFEIYLDLYAKPYKRSWEQDVGLFKRHLSIWSRRHVRDLRRGAVQQLHAEIGRACGPYVANRVAALLQTMINKAKLWGHFEGDNPVTGIERFQESCRDRVLSPEEIDRFLEAADEETDPTWGVFFRLALFTGARKTNIMQMRWEDLDLRSDEPIWRIPHTKNGDPHAIPLAPAAVAALRSLLERALISDWVFPGRRPGRPLSDVRRAFQRITDRAGLADIRIHDLRRTFGTYLGRMGASLPIVKKALGHKSDRAVHAYLHMDQTPVRAAVSTAIDSMSQHSAA